MVLSKVTLATLLWSDGSAESLGGFCKMQIPSITFKEALPTLLPLWGKYPSDSSTNGRDHIVTAEPGVLSRDSRFGIW